MPSKQPWNYGKYIVKNMYAFRENMLRSDRSMKSIAKIFSERKLEILDLEHNSQY